MKKKLEIFLPLLLPFFSDFGEIGGAVLDLVPCRFSCFALEGSNSHLVLCTRSTRCTVYARPIRTTRTGINE